MKLGQELMDAIDRLENAVKLQQEAHEHRIAAAKLLEDASERERHCDNDVGHATDEVLRCVTPPRQSQTMGEIWRKMGRPDDQR